MRHASLLRIFVKKGQGEHAPPTAPLEDLDPDLLSHLCEQFLGGHLRSFLLEEVKLVHHLRQRRPAHHLLTDRGYLLVDLEADRGADVILRDGLRDDDDRDARFVELRDTTQYTLATNRMVRNVKTISHFLRRKSLPYSARPFSMEGASLLSNPAWEMRPDHDGKNEIPGRLPPMSTSSIYPPEPSDTVSSCQFLST